MKYRIAVIEDNNADVYLLEDALEKQAVPCEFDRLEDGGSARTYILAQRIEQPNLILLDLNLPKIEGVELLRLIRQQSPLSGIPVLVWSSAHPPRDRESAEDFSGTRFVLKPSTLEGFAEVGGIIRDMLSGAAKNSAGEAVKS